MTGAFLITMAAITGVAVVGGLAVFSTGTFAAPDGGWLQAPAWPTHLIGALDLQGALSLGLLDVVFVFLFVDFFDTTGTVLALGRATGIHTDSAELPRARGTFLADALATTAGALLGTSTTTAYICLLYTSPSPRD